jgi:hypothetical protein
MRVLTCSVLAAAALAAGAWAEDHHMGPMAPYPDLAHASRAHKGQARTLWRATLRSAQQRFATYSAALAAGYVHWHRDWARPLVFHLRKGSYNHDGRMLDARRPESLVYWWPEHGSPVLLGFMYRVGKGRPPELGGSILHYHRHASYGPWMTHVWLTRSLKTAYARCLPVAALERAIPAFHYMPPHHGGSGPESAPCSMMMG